MSHATSRMRMLMNDPMRPCTPASGACTRTCELLLLLLFLAAVPAASAQTISFSQSTLAGESSSNPTSLQFGPDERLYVAQQNGIIYAYTVVRNAENDYQVTATEEIDLIPDGVPNHNDDGTPNATQQRQVTGIHVTGTAANPVLYVTSSDWRISVGDDSGLDTNSGVVTRLTCTGGLSADTCQAWEAVDIVRGLPRSEENHSTNGLDLDESTNTLYVMQGGHANKGAPGNNFSGTPEYYFSAALLSVDLDAIEAMPVYTDPRNGRDFIYDLRTLDDPTRTNIDNTDTAFPYPPGHPLYDAEIDPGDPFGGNNGLNQAIPEPGGPVQVYAPGFRNAYDVVLTENGRLYTSDNGPNGGWGGTALLYASDGTPKGSDPADFDQAAGDYCTNEFNEDNSSGHGDPLHFISGPGYYGGHQAPIRAFPGKAGLYVYEEIGGVWTETAFHNFQDLLPPDLSLTDFPDNPVECSYSANDPDTYLDIIGASTNGITEYTASNFEGAMQGNLLTASFNGNIYRYELNAAGDAYVVKNTEFSSFGSNPLDVTAQGDGAIFAGTVWAATHGSNDIVVFEPVDFGACDTTDPLADADADGYTNGDEADNGTNPCSSASKPSDFDGDLVSDLNDDDDDDDGILDVADVFALDPDNGTATGLPVSYPLWNNDPGTGLFGLGFTGLMLPDDGTTTWLDLFDEENLAAGGASGKLTVEEVTDGDAHEGNNSQENAFQFGIAVDQNTAPFVVQVGLDGPFFDGEPGQNYESQGFYIGTGDQDNFLKIVLDPADDGIEVAFENNGSATGATYSTPDIYAGDGTVQATSVDLFLVVNPAAGTVQPKYSVGSSAPQNVGPAVTLAGDLLTVLQSASEALAIGVIATSFGPADPFVATWDFINVYEAPSETQALVQVTPAGGINASTFGNDSFIIENLATAAGITSVTFDVSTALLPDVVFDPDGTAGDGTFKDFTVTTESGGDSDVGVTGHTFGAALDGGFQTLTVDFDDFEPGETLMFAVDMDPTTINGTSAPGPGESGSISGLELTGTTVTITFSDGSVHTADLFRGPGSTLGGSENVVCSPVPAQPALSVDGVTLTTPSELASHFKTATLGQETQTVHVDAPVGSVVRLLVLEAALFEQSGGGARRRPLRGQQRHRRRRADGDGQQPGRRRLRRDALVERRRHRCHEDVQLPRGDG